MKQNIIFYSIPQCNINIKVLLKNEAFWLSQNAMTTLFAVKIPAISKHLTNIFESNE